MGGRHLRGYCAVVAATVSIALAPAAARAQQGETAAPASLSIDYFELRGAGDGASVFIDLTAETPIGKGTAAAKLSTDAGLGEAFAGAETQLRYSVPALPLVEAIAGLRADIVPGETDLFPYLGIALAPLPEIASEVLLFVSETGHVLGRAEVVATVPVTAAVALESKAEVNWAKHSSRFGPAGLGSLELASRILVPAGRRAAVYVGIVHARLLGGAARIAREDGESAARTAVAAGLRLTL